MRSQEQVFEMLSANSLTSLYTGKTLHPTILKLDTNLGRSLQFFLEIRRRFFRHGTSETVEKLAIHFVHVARATAESVEKNPTSSV